MNLTVAELIKALEEMPQSSKVTNECGYILINVQTEPKELEDGDWVWFEFSNTETD